ncbi:MAG: hypothetical protein B1H13_14970 [Desulfobacteraceae bacterium 4484_190.3]|nr:MAG: hypothetical protein B1H13_14970 [Desulfobacteraceae bacterium 4484_190.3]
MPHSRVYFYGPKIIKNGKVVQIAKKIKESAGEVIDAKGLYVLPGGIDIHTHLDMPFMGSFSSDDFETGTIAAAFGGTTSLVDFAIQGKRMSLKGTLNTWMKKARKKAVIDYGFHVAITDLNDRVMNEIPEMVAMGVPSFKCFLAYKGALMIDDGILINDLLAQGKTEPKYHALSRPPEAEAEATGRGIAIAQMAGAPIYIVHLTCKEALAKVKEARDAGFPVLAETCPQYLLKSYQNYLEPGFQGAKYVMSPPLRDKSNWDVLWKGLAYGDLQVVSTDHCPFNFKGQKDKGKKNFALIPNGAPGIEHRVMLLFHEGVNKKKIGLNRFVELVSTAPAKLFGLFPHSNGQIIVNDGKFLGKPGTGRFLKRRPFRLTA